MINMILHPTVAIVVKKNGKFLLIKRANRPNKNYWAVPGGHVDKGETAYEAAFREAGEEIGGVVINKKPVYNFIHDVEIGHRHKCRVFLGRASAKIKAGSDAKDAGWFTLNQMRRMNLTNYTIRILNELYDDPKHRRINQYSRQA